MTEALVSLLFVVLSAFYAGALITVLVSEESLPFDTIQEGLRAFPEWKVLLSSGNNYMFRSLLDMDDPDIRKADEHATTQEALRSNRNIEDTIRMLSSKEAKHFFFESSYRVLPKVESMRQSGTSGDHLDLVQFCSPPVRAHIAFLLPRSSPFRRLTHAAALKAWEGGEATQILRRWTWGNGPVTSRNKKATTGLSLPHLTVAFTCFGLGVLVVVALLGAEVLHSSTTRHSNIA